MPQEKNKTELAPDDSVVSASDKKKNKDDDCYEFIAQKNRKGVTELTAKGNKKCKIAIKNSDQNQCSIKLEGSSIIADLGEDKGRLVLQLSPTKGWLTDFSEVKDNVNVDLEYNGAKILLHYDAKTKSLDIHSNNKKAIENFLKNNNFSDEYKINTDFSSEKDFKNSIHKQNKQSSSPEKVSDHGTTTQESNARSTETATPEDSKDVYAELGDEFSVSMSKIDNSDKREASVDQDKEKAVSQISQETQKDITSNDNVDLASILQDASIDTGSMAKHIVGGIEDAGGIKASQPSTGNNLSTNKGHGR